MSQVILRFFLPSIAFLESQWVQGNEGITKEAQLQMLNITGDIYLKLDLPWNTPRTCFSIKNYSKCVLEIS